MSPLSAAQLSWRWPGSASTAAVLDACDAGAQHVRLDPGYYQSCGALLYKIFTMVDAKTTFPSLIEQSAAARDVAESVQMGHLEVSPDGLLPATIGIAESRRLARTSTPCIGLDISLLQDD